MIGLLVALVGVVVASTGIVLTFGLWTLMPVGAVLLLVGLFVDLDSLKEPPHGKRDQSAP